MSASIEVTPVATRADRREFLDLPWRLHREDPNWIPPLRSDQAELVGYRPHPFYERNEAQTFLARRDGKVCGRVAAIHNRVYIEHRSDPRGFFGFFESIDDPQVADALLTAVRQWFAARNILQVRGPANPGINYVWGLLTDGFDGPPTFMMPYNPPYYPRLIETAGFEKAEDLYAYWGHRGMMSGNTPRFKPFAEKVIDRYQIRLRPLNRRRFLADVEEFLGLYNRALDHVPSFAPMSPGEIRHLAKGLQWLIVPELAVGAEVDGRLVGAVFALPDYNPRIRQIDGRLFPFGFARLLWNKQRIKRVRILAATVLPEYAMMGIGLVLMRALIPKALEWGLEEAEFSWVAESNHFSRGSLEKAGAKRIRTYRVYDSAG
jgi:GNAT superfamily N-acetyltransferase